MAENRDSASHAVPAIIGAMCIRYSKDQRELVIWSRQIEAWVTYSDWTEGADTFPGYVAPIAMADETHGVRLELARWGLQPWWAKKKSGHPDPNWGKKNAYNARSETVFQKATFRDAIKNRRCIVPATAIFERGDGRWVSVRPVDEAVFGIAALYEPQNSLSNVTTYSLVTTEPNAIMGEVHDRMPVILSREDYGMWLDLDTPREDLVKMMTPCPDEWLRIEDGGPIVTTRKPKEPA